MGGEKLRTHAVDLNFPGLQRCPIGPQWEYQLNGKLYKSVTNSLGKGSWMCSCIHRKSLYYCPVSGSPLATKGTVQFKGNRYCTDRAGAMLPTCVLTVSEWRLLQAVSWSKRWDRASPAKDHHAVDRCVYSGAGGRIPGLHLSDIAGQCCGDGEAALVCPD